MHERNDCMDIFMKSSESPKEFVNSPGAHLIRAALRLVEVTRIDARI